MDGDLLIYDGDCPICQRYVLWTGLREAHPGIRLLDARQHPDLVETLRADGIEVNDTFMLQLDGERLVGAAAMARISVLMERRTSWQRSIKRLTASERWLMPIYPWLVGGRKLLLRVLGRDQIR